MRKRRRTRRRARKLGERRRWGWGGHDEKENEEVIGSERGGSSISAGPILIPAQLCVSSCL